MDFETRKGEIDHLSSSELADLTAAMMILITERAYGRAYGRADIVCILEDCLVGNADSRPASPAPWHVIHDEDLITLHRHDDAKPVLLFTKRNP
jgi:hypothetical protein